MKKNSPLTNSRKMLNRRLTAGNLDVHLHSNQSSYMTIDDEHYGVKGCFEINKIKM